MKHVLVVDDSPTMRLHLATVLGQAGHATVQASDGLDALAKITANTALVLCDVNMPRMDGMTFLERLRQDPRWRSLAVVMLTTEGDPAMIERAKRLGARGWMVKPFKPDQLLAAVARLTAAPATAAAS